MIKQLPFVCLCFLYSLNAFGQTDKLTAPIVAEGKKLYQSEMASWYGTDIFLEVFQDRPSISGYFSYDEGSGAKCIFYSKGEEPKVIGMISFDSTYDSKTAITSLARRDFTAAELSLYKIRTSALALLRTDTSFKLYKNTDLNIIPIISNEEKKVYVLTGPKETGVVIFGNDYLIRYDKDDNVTEKKPLHKNALFLKYGNGDSAVEAYHTHLPETGDFITPTDICTLMLYEKFTTWKQHSVVSKNYISIWNCITNTLVVIPTETLKKINKNK